LRSLFYPHCNLISSIGPLLLHPETLRVISFRFLFTTIVSALDPFSSPYFFLLAMFIPSRLAGYKVHFLLSWVGCAQYRFFKPQLSRIFEIYQFPDTFSPKQRFWFSKTISQVVNPLPLTPLYDNPMAQLVVEICSFCAGCVLRFEGPILRHGPPRIMVVFISRRWPCLCCSKNITQGVPFTFS